MLLNEQNYKAPPAIVQPSVAGFKAWLERQPREQSFNFGSIDHCALGLYLRTIGTDCMSLSGKNYRLYAQLERFPRAACLGRRGHQTFGDVLDEINKAGAA